MENEAKNINAIKKPKRQCDHPDCKKKIGLTGFKCDCGFVYCGLHRYPQEHNCSLDESKRQLEILENNLTVVKKAKIDS